MVAGVVMKRRAATGARPRVTMKDVGAAAGVSPSTVSRILNDAPLMVPVTAQTRARVIEAATRLGYTTGRAEVGERRVPRMQFGVIMPETPNNAMAGYVASIIDEANARGYNVVLGHGREQAGDGLVLPPPLDASRVDAIFLLGSAPQGGRLRGMPPLDVPVVSLLPGPGSAGQSTVSADQPAGIEDAVAHLVGSAIAASPSSAHRRPKRWPSATPFARRSPPRSLAIDGPGG